MDWVLHPTLKKLLEKLANPEYSVRDAHNERFDWVRAGCPVLAQLGLTEQQKQAIYFRTPRKYQEPTEPLFVGDTTPIDPEENERRLQLIHDAVTALYEVAEDGHANEPE